MNNEIKPLNLDTDVEVKTEKAPDEAQPQTQNSTPKTKKKFGFKVSGLMIGLILLGSLTGFGLSRLKKEDGSVKKYKTSTEEGVAVGDTFGVQDEKVFSDPVEGTLTAGGIEGEGSHHLTREGGVSQNVYLTSSVIDLDQFLDKKVKVWGQTFEGQKAGWLMDVGRLQILE